MRPIRWQRRSCFASLNGGLFDGCSNASVGSAPADIPGHGGVNVDIAWVWFRLQKSSGRHDLTSLAIAALRHIDLLPRPLKRCAHGHCPDALDGGDFLSDRLVNGEDAGS